MSLYCVDTVVRAWLSDNPSQTYKSSHINFIVNYDGLDFSSADFNDQLDELIASHAKYILENSPTASIEDEIVVISPLVMGITECG